ncbi:hypothetical protein C1646_775490, partial [Rhizophagus diaphanus]
MSSQASSSASPASITEEISIRTMSDVVRDFNTEELIKYLGRKDLKLDENDIKILRKEKIAGLDFLNTTKEDQKLRNYFSLKTLDDLKEMLRKNKVNGEDITNIKQFTPVFEEISDDDKAFKHCMEDIILKLSNVETMTDANEAMRCEFISAILHASIAITKKLTSQDIFIVLQKDISSEDATGRVDYAIKSLEDLLCITEGKSRNIKIGYVQNLAQLESAFQTNKKKRTADQAFGNDYFDYIYGIVTTGTEWHFIIYIPDGIYSMSGSEYQINLTKSTVKDNPELLRSNVKRIMSSELEVLKQRIIELEAKNAEIPVFRRKISEFDAERAEFKRRIAEALRMIEEERTRCVAENAKLNARIEELESEFRDRITKVEQKQTQNDNSSNNNSSNFNL